MATTERPARSGGSGDEEEEEEETFIRAGFAKLQGEDFHFYVQKYSILLGRGGSRRANLDVDLGRVGGGRNVSRVHARIFYDFPHRRFALEVIGRNGCYVEGVHYGPGCPPVKLDSQDLIQMGMKKFYFLLPLRSVTGGGYELHRAHHANRPSPRQTQLLLPVPQPSEWDGSPPSTDDDDDGHHRKKGAAGAARPAVVIKAIGSGGQPEEAREDTSATDRKEEEDEKDALLQEEREIISCAAIAISELGDPGEWVSVKKLHSVLLERFGEVWQPNRVKTYLAPEGGRKSRKAHARAWAGLVGLMKRHPEQFVINTMSTGRRKKELVSLVPGM